MDKGNFVKRDFTVTPTGNGGIIAYLTRPVNEQDRGSVANPSDRVSFTTPVDFIEWLKGEYGTTIKNARIELSDFDFLAQAEKRLFEKPAGCTAGDKRTVRGTTYALWEFRPEALDPYWEWLPAHA